MKSRPTWRLAISITAVASMLLLGSTTAQAGHEEGGWFGMQGQWDDFPTVPSTTYGDGMATALIQAYVYEGGYVQSTYPNSCSTWSYKSYIDGYWGGCTDVGVREFQSQNSLTVDGIVGWNTWHRMQSDVHTYGDWDVCTGNVHEPFFDPHNGVDDDVWCSYDPDGGYAGHYLDARYRENSQANGGDGWQVSFDSCSGWYSMDNRSPTIVGVPPSSC